MTDRGRDGASPGDVESGGETADEPEPTVITATELASHIVCPRQYEFEHERPLTPRATGRNRVRRRRRELLRQSIIAGLRLDEVAADERVDAALRRFDRLWTSSQTPYLADEQVEYDERVVKTAIERYLSRDGHEHGRNAVAVDTTVGYERDGVRYEATLDAVVKRDGGYLGITYVPDMNGVLQTGWYDDNVERFRDGRGYYPRQLGSFVEAAIAIRGLMNEYGLEPSYDFAYVALLESSRPSYGSVGDVHVDIDERHFWTSYEDERADLVGLIEERADAIRAGDTDPRNWRFHLITDRSCEYCAYRDACPDHIASAVSFTDRRRPGAEAQTRADSATTDEATTHDSTEDDR